MQLFVLQSQISNDSILLFSDQFHYVTRVCRVKVGETLDFVVEHAFRLTVKITDIRDSKLFFTLLKKEDFVSSSLVDITLVQGCPKQDKLSDVINMCAQAGLGALIPIMTGRCVVDYPAAKQMQKVQRWRTIAADACRQSQQPQIMGVSDIMSVEHFLRSELHHTWDLKLVLWEEATQPLKSVLEAFSNDKAVAKVGVVVGPEGGLSRQEVDLFIEQGFVSVSLGKTILRTENAGFFAVAQLLYHFS